MKVYAGLNRVIVKVVEKEKTDGGLYLPNTNSESIQGEVIDCGPTDIKITLANSEKPYEISIGSQVVFGKYVGVDIIHENETFKSVKLDDIIAIIE